jgi:hypothetical protein
VAGPRLRHQRQLALANALFSDFQEAKQSGVPGSECRLGMAYARHLCATHPGCRSVTLHAQEHLIPDIELVREKLSAKEAPPFDLFDEALFAAPQWIGDYTCGGL